jgi:hypothetical protein
VGQAGCGPAGLVGLAGWPGASAIAKGKNNIFALKNKYSTVLRIDNKIREHSLIEK